MSNMAGFIAKQPNGLYCRFSFIVDCPTNWNMTREDYINMRVEQAKEDARKDAEDILNNLLQPFENVIDSFIPNSMSQEEFDKFLDDVGYIRNAILRRLINEQKTEKEIIQTDAY